MKGFFWCFALVLGGIPLALLGLLVNAEWLMALGAGAIATVVADAGGQALSEFGGVILVRAGDASLKTLADLPALAELRDPAVIGAELHGAAGRD